MNWAIEYVEIDDYVKVTSEGIFSIKAYPACFRRLFSSPFWEPGIDLLFDNRKLRFERINLEKLRAVSGHYYQVRDQLGAGRLAVLMKSPHDFGIGRQFEMISEGRGEREICIFREEQAALGWLLKKTSTSPVYTSNQLDVSQNG